jgi:hypothetical protein
LMLLMHGVLPSVPGPVRTRWTVVGLEVRRRAAIRKRATFAAHAR